MVSKLRHAVASVAVVAVALFAGIVAAGSLSSTPFSAPAGPSGQAASGARPGDSPGAEPSRQASRPSGDVAVLVGAGDVSSCESLDDALTADLVESIPGIVFALGDNAGDGRLRDYEECYTPTWGRPSIKDRTRPVLGDNEYGTLGARGHFEYFGEAAGDPSTGYYAYDAGDWRVYVLNSECSRVGGCGPGSAQEAWLLADLEAEPRRCSLAMLHRPYFTSGPSGGGSSATRNLWRILQDAGAEILLSGHDHHYERFAPQTGAGIVDPRGIVQFVVGTGGGEPDDILVAPNSEASATDVAGVLRLELAPDGYAFEFITVAGPEFSDSGTGACH